MSLHPLIVVGVKLIFVVIQAGAVVREKEKGDTESQCLKVRYGADRSKER